MKPLNQNKMTAVEWLITEIGHGGLISKKQFAGIVQQAKEMEKEQIMNAHNNGHNYYEENSLDAEQYYNETFKTK